MADPISALIGVGGGLLTSLFGGHKGSSPQVQLPATPPPPVQQPIGAADTNKAKAGQASFLSAAAPAASSQNQGGKSLLGQ